MFVGAALGLLLYQWTGKKWAVPVLVLGAILPDIIDKPLGHLLLANTLDYGRIYAHSMLFLIAILLVAAVLWKARSSPVMAILGLGVATHLVLDSMWEDPVTLMWPLLGPFQPHHFPDYFGSSFVAEISSPLEWMFGIMLASILILLYRDRLGPAGERVARALEPLQLPVLAFLTVAGALTLGTGVLTSFTDWTGGQLDVMAGACAMVGGGLLLRRELRRSGYYLSNP